jgi:3-isopropylmalate/(R)-2-methylmalate dehydratase small subunit
MSGTAAGTLEGNAWVFGDNIDTGFIMPGTYGSLPDEELAQHVMSGIDPEFAGKVQPGDIVVGGKMFGCGSSRETAPRGLKFAGVGVIIAQSFARTFFRNAISIGLPVLICPEAGAIEQGDRLRADPIAGEIENLTQGKLLQSESLPDHLMEMVRAGGLVPYLRERQQNK